MQTYDIVKGPDKRGKCLVRRHSDGKVAMCKANWLESVDENGVWAPCSNTKAIRMDGLDWQAEVTV